MKSFIAVIGTFFTLGVTAQEKTLCSTDEKVVFSCQIPENRKIVSLCASQDSSATKGYLQYRFGKITKIELQFPEPKQPAGKNFLYAKDKHLTMETISFSRDKFSYELVYGEDNRGRPYGTVIVNKSGELLAAFDCEEGAPFANTTPKQVGIR